MEKDYLIYDTCSNGRHGEGTLRKYSPVRAFLGDTGTVTQHAERDSPKDTTLENTRGVVGMHTSFDGKTTTNCGRDTVDD